MDRNKIIIVEGPQGTGKSTLANYLRDNMAGCQGMRLSGHKCKTIEGKKYSILMYNSFIELLKNMEKVPTDLVFDRIFFSEEVYARLGYKDYSFTDEYLKLLERLNALNYDIHYLALYLENVELFRQRLDRESHHNYQAFSIESSVNQQNVYMEIAKEVELCDNIDVHRIPMDDFEKSYTKIKTMFGIK